MSTNFADRIYPRDTHANRPAATTLKNATLYPCSTHGKVYRVQGGAWVDWIVEATTGESWEGSWSAGTYTDGQIVEHDDVVYQANTTTTDEPPGTDWDVLYTAPAGGASFSPDPTITQEKAAGASASSITLDSAPSSGQRVILFCNAANTADPTAVSSTNTTWTKVASSASAGAKYSIWIGVVAGGAGGTAISITHTNPFLSCRAIVTNIPIVATAVQTANHATGASLSGVTVGNVIVIGGGNDNTAVNVSLASSDATGYALHGYRPGSHVSVISALMVGYAASTTIPGLGTSTSKVLMVELAV